MTAQDRRDDSTVFFFPQSSRSNGTSMSNMSFEESSWGDFSKSRDVTPQKPTRGKTRRYRSMIETSSGHGFGASTTDGFGVPPPDFLGSDVFGSDVLATDPWGDSSDQFQRDAGDYNESTSRTAALSDSSEEDEIFAANFACEFPAADQGTIPLRDHKEEKKTERSRGRSVPRACRGRDSSVGRQPNQRGPSSGRSPSVGRMVPKVLTDDEVAAKRRHRSRSKNSGRSYRSKPSFVAVGSRRGRSVTGSRRGRSLSVPRDASRFHDQRTESEQYLSHSNHTRKAHQKPKSPSATTNGSRSRGFPERKNPIINNNGGNQATPLNDLDRHRKTPLEDKPKKAQEDRSPKVPGAKSSKATKEKSKKGPKDKALKVCRARSKSPRARSLLRSTSEGPKDKSSKGSNDGSSKSPRARSKSPKARRARSKSPKAQRTRSKSPKAQRARSKSPKARRARSKSPKAQRARSKSPKRAKSPKSQRDKSPRTPRDGSRKTRSNPKQFSKQSPSKSDKKSTKLFASPLPQKSYLSRGTQKRCVAGVSAGIDKRRFNIKASLSNLLSDDEGSNEFKKCVGGQSSAPETQRERSRQYRRHSMLGATPSGDSDHSRKSQNSFSRPKSAESLIETRSRRSQNKDVKQMRRNSLHGN